MMMRFEFVPSGDCALATSVDLPDADADGVPNSARPVVIVVHGLTGQRLGRSYHLVELARLLNERGIACVRFDQSGCGESTGRFVDHTIGRMVSDTHAIRRWAVDQPWCDADRVGCVGLSVGALPVIDADAHLPANAIALFGPVFDMPRVFSQTAKTGLRALLQYQGWVPYRGLPVGKAFVDALDEVDTAARLADSNAPILLFHSKTDDVVRFEESTAYVDRCRQLDRPCDLVAVDNADHDFSDIEHRRIVLDRTVEFLAERLGAD